MKRVIITNPKSITKKKISYKNRPSIIRENYIINNLESYRFHLIDFKDTFNNYIIGIDEYGE